ncbi:hypothetical protein F5146DRAFT_1030196 [Armillaria mellea]|nr:hypothetical protein F5146DRAFT_1030196 [Armillaria mellea]
MSIISTTSTSFHLTKPFVFHTVHTSRTGYVKKNCTMGQLKDAAVDYVKVDATEENREKFSSPREPEDKARSQDGVHYSRTSSGVVFCWSQWLMLLLPPVDIHALLENFRKEFQKESTLKRPSDSKFDAFHQSLEAVEEDNEDLRKEVTTLKKEVEGMNQEIAALKSENVDLRGRIATLERGYEDVHGWLSDKDTEYMDRIRLRHILDCGQARLARIAKVPVSGDYPVQSAVDLSRAWRACLPKSDNDERLAKARSLLADCDDAETRDMADDVLRHFTARPSDTRNEGDRTAHPDNVGESAYKGVIERQPEDQWPLLRQVVAYGLKFRVTVASNQSLL